MDIDLQAPLILITGGGRGVGAATARLAAAQGYNLAISFVSNETAALAVAADVEAVERRPLSVRADSADPEQVAQLFAAIDREFGRIDVLVNNHATGGTETAVGIGLALLFAGGAFGKASCGWLGIHLGVIWTVIATETATALLIMATVFLPLKALYIPLPFLGVVQNGTSSVLYGTVPELAPKGDTGRAFALFYTAVIGAGGFAPIAYGTIADHSSKTIGITASALTAMLILPLVFRLRRFSAA